jgi:hypothetical protein
MLPNNELEAYFKAFRRMVELHMRVHCVTASEHADWFAHWQFGWFAHREGKPFERLGSSEHEFVVLEPKYHAWRRGWNARKKWFESTLEPEAEAVDGIPVHPDRYPEPRRFDSNPDGSTKEGDENV